MSPTETAIPGTYLYGWQAGGEFMSEDGRYERGDVHGGSLADTPDV